MAGALQRNFRTHTARGTAQGSAPEAILQRPDPHAHATSGCATVNCTAKWYFTTPPLHAYNQGVVVMMQMEKPTVRGHTALDKYAVDFPVTLFLNISGTDGHGTVHHIQHNAEHTRSVHCPQNSHLCDVVELVALTSVQYYTYTVGVAVPHPTLAFARRSITDAVSAEFWIVTVAREYTLFQVGFKYAFMAISFVVLLVFGCWLAAVPAVAQTSQQRGVAWTLAALVLLNDPFFAVAVTAPSPTWPVVAAFGTVLGFAALLTYWLVEMDTLRLMGEGRHSSSRALRLGACFWVPKVLLMALLFMTTLAVQWYVIYEVQVDPGYNVWEEDSVGRAAAGFAVFLAVVYLLWLLTLALFVLRVVRFLPGSYNISFWLILAAAIISMGAFFAGALFGAGTGLLFIAFYAGPNLYTLFAAWVFWPDRAVSDFDELSAEQAAAVGYSVKYRDEPGALAEAAEEGVQLGDLGVSLEGDGAAAGDGGEATFEIGDVDEEELMGGTASAVAAPAPAPEEGDGEGEEELDLDAIVASEA